MKKSKSLITICLFCLFTSIKAQAPKITASLDRYEIEVGEQVKLQLVAEYAPDMQVQFPLLKLDGELIEVAEIGDIDSTRLENDLIRNLQVIMVQAWDTGQYVIPSMRFSYVDSDKNIKGQFATEELIFFVTSPLENALPTPNPQDSAAVAGAEIRDIKAIKDVPFTWRDAVPYVLMGLVALLIAGGFYFWWRKRKEKEASAAAYVPPPRPAHEVAFEKLQFLEGEKYWQQGDVKKYYSELTNIVREYLEGRYDILALESTTDEILQDLKEEEFEAELWSKLKNMLQTADLVKFAKAKPDIEKHSHYLANAKEIVRVTKKTISLSEKATTNVE
ncbi:MAG: LPXTG cell wall anchor domain-containing protein [Chitinophagales bacterium]